MITHEEAIKIMQILESDDAYYGERIEEHKKMAEYITQQEKITELLDLYRNFQYHVYSGNVSPRDRLNEKIQKLEKELKEMK